MKTMLTVLLLTAVGAAAANGQSFSKAGTSAAQFLKIPVGAKGVAMGSAYTSLVDDATACYWNPAGVAGLGRLSGSLAHTSWIVGLTHDYAGIVVPLDAGSAIGISGIALQSEKIEQTTIELPEGTGVYYDAMDLALGLTYARTMTDQVQIGATVKYVSQRIWSETAETFALDLGVLLMTGYKDMRVGFSFQNFGPGLRLSGRELIRQLDQDANSSANPYLETTVQTQQWGLPTSYRVSTSISLVGQDGMITMEDSRLRIAVDAIHLNDNPEHYSVGGEYEFARTFALRGGYVFKTDEEGMTLGAGLHVPFGSSVFTFDYAYAAFGVFGNVQYFTVSAGF